MTRLPPPEAHCGAENGPVVQAAEQALETGDFSEVAIWVAEEYADELRQKLDQSLVVHETGGKAGELEPVACSRVYSPANRLFLNVLYIDVTAVPDFHKARAARWHTEGGVDLAQLLEELCRLFRETFALGERISVELEAESVAVPAATAETVTLIVNEALTNAVKHGYGGNHSGRIRVLLGRESQLTGSVAVDDDGAGPARDRQRRLE